MKDVFDSGISNYSCKVEVFKDKRKTIKEKLELILVVGAWSMR